MDQAGKFSIRGARWYPKKPKNSTITVGPAALGLLGAQLLASNDRIDACKGPRLFEPFPTEMKFAMKPIDHLKNLVIMASADGSLTEREIDWLVDRCTELGLDEADLGNALEYAISEEAAMKLPRAPEEQERLLSDLIKIMAADGELDEIEKRLFAVAAAKMNVQQTQLDQLITKLVDKQ